MFAVSTALAIGGAVSNYQQQSAAAKAQEEQNRQIAELNTKQQQSAVEAYALDTTQIQAKANFERDSATEQLAAARTEMLEAKSRARVSAGEAGVSGLSIEALMGGFDLDYSNFAAQKKRNVEAGFDQAELEKKGAKATASSRYNNITPTRAVQEPSLLALGLGIAGGTANAYGKYLYDPDNGGRTTPRGGGQKRGSDSSTYGYM